MKSSTPSVFAAPVAAVVPLAVASAVFELVRAEIVDMASGERGEVLRGARTIGQPWRNFDGRGRRGCRAARTGGAEHGKFLAGAPRAGVAVARGGVAAKGVEGGIFVRREDRRREAHGAIRERGRGGR